MKPLTEPIGSAADAPPPKTPTRHAISLQVKGENVLFAVEPANTLQGPALQRLGLVQLTLFLES